MRVAAIQWHCTHLIDVVGEVAARVCGGELSRRGSGLGDRGGQSDPVARLTQGRGRGQGGPGREGEKGGETVWTVFDLSKIG